MFPDVDWIRSSKWKSSDDNTDSSTAAGSDGEVILLLLLERLERLEERMRNELPLSETGCRSWLERGKGCLLSPAVT